MKLGPAEENFEDEDLLEMVDAGLIPMIVMDSHKAQFWTQIFDKIKVHSVIAVRTGGEIAWAFAKKVQNSRLSSMSSLKATKRAP